jgi:hypothetical protein
MPGPSPFAGDWRDCLRAHYQYVLRSGDTTTERTLVGVLHEVGFSDHDLAELKVLATLRADELPPGFVPDLDALTDAAVQQLQAPAAAPAQPEPAIFAAAFPDPAPDSEPGVPAPDAPSPDDEEPPDYRSDAPEQLSMF